MKASKVLDTLQKLKVPLNTWNVGNNFKYIILTSGEIIPVSYETTRFKFQNKFLLLKYGESEGYGSIILNPTFSFGGSDCTFSKIRKSIKNEKIQFPKPGDVFRVYENGKTIFESFIVSSSVASNGTCIKLSKPFNYTLNYLNVLFTYFSIIQDNELNIKGEPDGLYLKFNPVNNKEYQRKVKYSEIKSIISIEGICYD